LWLRVAELPLRAMELPLRAVALWLRGAGLRLRAVELRLRAVELPLRAAELRLRVAELRLRAAELRLRAVPVLVGWQWAVVGLLQVRVPVSPSEAVLPVVAPQAEARPVHSPVFLSRRPPHLHRRSDKS
jgi:hypothetical protein